MHIFLQSLYIRYIWIEFKHIEEELENQPLSTNEARTIANNCQLISIANTSQVKL